MTNAISDERAAELRYLVGEGWPQDDAAKVLEDADLWLLPAEQRYPLEGEQAVSEWENALAFAVALDEGFHGSAVIGDATRQLIGDMRVRAEEALQRARERNES